MPGLMLHSNWFKSSDFEIFTGVSSNSNISVTVSQLRLGRYLIKFFREYIAEVEG